MTVVLVMIVLVAAAIVYVVAPIGRRPREIVEPDDVSDAEQRKRVALSGILDLEEERDGGKLSDGDFRSLRARYEGDAITAMRQLDAETDAITIEERLEREIAAARQKVRCATCGEPRDAAATRCPSCGSPY